MALEIDSFVMKFKNLWKSGRNANLTIKSNAGKAEVVLIVELDEPIHQTQHPHHQSSRNGPAWQRRHERRAAAREAAKGVTGNVTNENEAPRKGNNEVTADSAKEDDPKSLTGSE